MFKFTERKKKKELLRDLLRWGESTFEKDADEAVNFLEFLLVVDCPVEPAEVKLSNIVMKNTYQTKVRCPK